MAHERLTKMLLCKEEDFSSPLREIPEIKLNFRTVSKAGGPDFGEPRVEYIESPSRRMRQKEKITIIKELYEKQSGGRRTKARGGTLLPAGGTADSAGCSSGFKPLTAAHSKTKKLDSRPIRNIKSSTAAALTLGVGRAMHTQEDEHFIPLLAQPATSSAPRSPPKGVRHHQRNKPLIKKF